MKIVIEEYGETVIYIITGMMLAGVFWQILQRISGS